MRRTASGRLDTYSHLQRAFPTGWRLIDRRAVMSDYRWGFIADLPEDWPDLADPGLASFGNIWREQSHRLQQTDALRLFEERLAREWAIETGILENLYAIDRGITQLLIERGIEANLIPHGASDKPAELVVAFVRDQQDALEGLFAFVSQRRLLSTSYIKELHQISTRHQDTADALDADGKLRKVPLLKGAWKQWPNNPTRPDGEIHEYTPPEHVAAEMDSLIAMHLDHSARHIAPEVEAAFLHHRFTQIHPFQDGNGRVARALASLIFLRAGWFPLVITREMREPYIQALEAADQDDLSLLTKLFARVQNIAFRQAFSLSEDVLRTHESRTAVIQAAVDRLRAGRETRIQELRSVFDLSGRLEGIAMAQLQNAAEALKPALEGVDTRFDAWTDRSTGENERWFRRQIVEMARNFHYHADTQSYRAWVRLRIREERTTHIIVAFHSLGTDFLGILVASAFLEFRDRSEAGEPDVEGPYPLCEDIFQFAYNDSPELVVKRFTRWIDEVVLVGLDQWRRQL